MVQPPNEWVSRAGRLLATAVLLRETPSHPDPDNLLDALTQSLLYCDALAREGGIDEATRRCAGALVCRRLDEAIAGTPWGSTAVPAHELRRRSGLTVDDSQVVGLVDGWAADHQAEREPMELVHAALALDAASPAAGSGAAPLEVARERLGRLLGDRSAASSPMAARPVSARVAPTTPRMSDVMPVWVLASLAAVALTLLFVALRISVNSDSDPVFASLRAIDVNAADRPASSPALSPAVAAALAPRLATFLKQDIDAGLVLVNDMPDKSVITIRADSFFEPGSAVIADPARMFPLMGRIAAGLNAVPGQALVAGYTDAEHDHSVLYPSNWHLSQDRANVVTAILAESVDPQRLTAQGRADSEPAQDNATVQGRSDNRRVDITLVVGQPS